MEPKHRDPGHDATNSVHFHKTGETLSAAALEALNRRTAEEHKAAIEQALRRP